MNAETPKDRTWWEEKRYRLPKYDQTEVSAKTTVIFLRSEPRPHFFPHLGVPR